MRSVKLVTLLSVIILLSSAGAQDTDGDGYDDEYDHRDDVDATLMLKLHQFNTSESEEWDSSNGAPDIWFKVCVDADQERVDCYDSEVWADTYTLGNDWNLSINIPDDSSLITFTIQCRDDDVANDDECSNSEAGESVDSEGCKVVEKKEDPWYLKYGVQITLAIIGFIISTTLAVKKYRRN